MISCDTLVVLSGVLVVSGSGDIPLVSAGVRWCPLVSVSVRWCPLVPRPAGGGPVVIQWCAVQVRPGLPQRGGDVRWTAARVRVRPPEGPPSAADGLGEVLLRQRRREIGPQAPGF